MDYKGRKHHLNSDTTQVYEDELFLPEAVWLHRLVDAPGCSVALQLLVF